MNTTPPVPWNVRGVSHLTLCNGTVDTALWDAVCRAIEGAPKLGSLRLQDLVLTWDPQQQHTNSSTMSVLRELFVERVAIACDDRNVGSIPDVLVAFLGTLPNLWHLSLDAAATTVLLAAASAARRSSGRLTPPALRSLALTTCAVVGGGTNIWPAVLMSSMQRIEVTVPAGTSHDTVEAFLSCDAERDLGELSTVVLRLEEPVPRLFTMPPSHQLPHLARQQVHLHIGNHTTAAPTDNDRWLPGAWDNIQAAALHWLQQPPRGGHTGRLRLALRCTPPAENDPVDVLVQLVARLVLLLGPLTPEQVEQVVVVTTRTSDPHHVVLDRLRALAADWFPGGTADPLWEIAGDLVMSQRARIVA